MKAAAGKNRPLVVPVFLPHAGCPHRCIFCNQAAVCGADALPPNPARIRRSIESFLSGSRRRNRVEIAYFGGTFLGLPEAEVVRLLETAETFVADGRAHGIRFSTRPDSIDPLRLSWIRPFPVTTVEIGVQSLDDRVLETCGRGHTVADSEAAALRLRAAGLQVGLQLMVGLPGQDLCSVLDTAKKAACLRPDFIRIYPTLVLKGSPLAALYRKGLFAPLTLEEAVRQTAAAYRLFSENGIPVIRMGLQPTSELAPDGQVLAGPFHPAFGEQVRSAALHENLARALDQIPLRGKTVRIAVHPTRESQLRGPGNHHLKRLAERFGLGQAVATKDAGLDPDAIRIEADGKPVKMF